MLPGRSLAPTCEWDIAAADIIVREAGGVVLQAGPQASKGNPLGDWKVRGAGTVLSAGARTGLAGLAQQLRSLGL